MKKQGIKSMAQAFLKGGNIRLTENQFFALYKRYGKTTPAKIRRVFKTRNLVWLKHNGLNSIFGYYPLSEASMKFVLEEPRGYALTFTETQAEPILGLNPFKTITYLVKSSSRLILKPDIGEILDQIDEADMEKAVAICFHNDYQLLPNTDGEHFLMTASLLRKVAIVPAIKTK